MSPYDSTVRTRTLARIVGPYFVAIAVALCLRGDTMPEFLSRLMLDGALVFVAGAFTLIAGVGVLVANHHWSSFSAALISFIDAAATLKGATLMIAPDIGSDLTDAIARAPLLLQGAVCLQLLTGAWLCLVGYMREHIAFAFALKA